MVDTGTWNRLDDSSREEFHRLLACFQDALRSNGIEDGYDLELHWSVKLVDGLWSMSNGTKVLDGITSSNRDVIDALYADAVQNLNR